MNTEVHLVWPSLSAPELDGDPRRRHVDLTPVIYDLDVSPTLGARGLTADEAPGDLGEYVDTVVTDMRSLREQIVDQYATEWSAKLTDPSAATSFSGDRTRPELSDLYVRLLVDFANKHPELLINALASVLAEQIQAAANERTLSQGHAFHPAHPQDSTGGSL
ncbi:hypothetical protein FZI85_21840 [Mycobacterium sp. CBMA293]|uniref:hypothetical protein n=1 Tax=unclassified Mycolicibacterium TaxID=2636767 RepID=UPI0012DEB5F5|nr:MULTISPECIES: hypothetical protein [unclassified Mycolicibacterium]MUL47329.1 hypothetical protein [Mycolicibacterium sp. CBMA 360]MUL61442.1 hypothetical protein [Mycolicibacterium sp. CBMA 335]MUL72177.1 hypothetical protein [Mycolicibacterium sp. CBMA 311]MUL96344.1 hypothetical protein [Mycolicibacterium sp. CBMA 230]MUM08833.1 hypothetical protein [Mycolicibacterium sp. CBMA 213]